MYDYRRMTPAERTAVVEVRRSRGFPLHKPPHPEQGAGWYFITAATFERRNHFTTPPELTTLEGQLLDALTTTELTCGGGVILPNHYHVLVHTPTLAAVGRALRPVHGRSAPYANRRDGTPGRQVWCNFSDRQVRSERHMAACLHYVIWNPVKHGHVDAMADWPWSSVHELTAEHGVTWVEELVREYPLGDFGKDWDP
jgi:REP-associated tyrosine transposase